jgi:hypothetical protein
MIAGLGVKVGWRGNSWCESFSDRQADFHPVGYQNVDNSTGIAPDIP